MKKKPLFFCEIMFLALGMLSVSAQTTLWSEDFTYPDGTTQGSGIPPKWTIDISGATITPPDDWFEIKNNQMEGRDVDGVVEWSSEMIDISGYSSVTISIHLTEIGDLESTDYIRLYYIINSGSETIFNTHGDNTDDFTSRTANQTGLSGNTLQIVIRMRNNAAAEYHQFDNILVQGTLLTPEVDVQRPTGTSIIDHGTDNLGCQSVGTINLDYTIDNTLGSGPLLITTISGTNLNNVSLLSSTTPLPLQVASGTTNILNISFNVGPGPFRFNLSFGNNDSDENPYHLSISGTGTDSSPKISSIENQTIQEDEKTEWLVFTLSDSDTDPAYLAVSAGTDNQDLLPNSGISFQGSDATRSIRISPSKNRWGTGRVYLTASDGNNTSQINFKVTVLPVNDPPQFTANLDSVLIIQGQTYHIPVTGLEGCVEDNDTPISSLTWSIENNIHIQYTVKEDTLVITAPTDWLGTETIIIIVSDGEFDDTTTLVVNVEPGEVSSEQTAVKAGQIIPKTFSLNQNFPNPFNPKTTITYSLPEQTHVKLEIYNMQGQLMTILENGTRSAGVHTAQWDASHVPTGIYLYKISTPQFTSMRKCMLVK